MRAWDSTSDSSDIYLTTYLTAIDREPFPPAKFHIIFLSIACSMCLMAFKAIVLSSGPSQRSTRTDGPNILAQNVCSRTARVHQLSLSDSRYCPRINRPGQLHQFRSQYDDSMRNGMSGRRRVPETWYHGEISVQSMCLVSLKRCISFRVPFWIENTTKARLGSSDTKLLAIDGVGSKM